MVLSSSLDRIDQHLIQNVLLKITYKGELVIEFLKITSFRLNQVAQQKAKAPIKIAFWNFEGKLLLQEPNKSAAQ